MSPCAGRRNNWKHGSKGRAPAAGGAHGSRAPSSAASVLKCAPESQTLGEKTKVSTQKWGIMWLYITRHLCSALRNTSLSFGVVVGEKNPNWIWGQALGQGINERRGIQGSQPFKVRSNFYSIHFNCMNCFLERCTGEQSCCSLHFVQSHHWGECMLLSSKKAGNADSARTNKQTKKNPLPTFPSNARCCCPTTAAAFLRGSKLMQQTQCTHCYEAHSYIGKDKMCESIWLRK